MLTPKFNNNPITEALFDIQIDPPLVVSSQELEDSNKEFSALYPEKKQIRILEAKFQMTANTPTHAEHTDHGVSGYQFWSVDKKQVVQVKLEGFSFSRLKPYEAWEKSKPEALRTWNLYRGKFLPQFIKRIALRYINVIEIPGTRIELDDYFNNAPKVPQELPQNLEGFLNRQIIRYDESTRIVLTFTTHISNKPNVNAFLLDIDVSSDRRLQAPFEKIDEELDRLHKIAEDIFMKSTTTNTKELIK